MLNITKLISLLFVKKKKIKCYIIIFIFQVYLSLRFGPDAMASLMPKILSTIDRVRSFSQRLREFLNDVTRCGLQKQFESVCENIGLIAFLLQTEPKYEQVV